MRRIRFSLPFVFIVMTIVACLCYVLMIPTLNAQRFVTAITDGDYEAADALFANANDRFLEQWDNDYTIVKCRAQVEPPTWRGLWRGERQASVLIVYQTPTRTLPCTVRVMATRAGLGRPQRQRSSGSMGGGLADRNRILPPFVYLFPSCSV